jgi:hypothetical protein
MQFEETKGRFGIHLKDGRLKGGRNEPHRCSSTSNRVH